MIAAVMFVVVRDAPARADHGITTGGFEFGATQEPFNTAKDAPKTFSISFFEPVVRRTLVMMEIEQGQSDPDYPAVIAGTATTQTSYEKPDAFCYIEAGATECSIEFTFKVVPITGVDNVTARFYLNKHLIDTFEQPNESNANPSSNGCDGITGGPEYEFESDNTEAAQIFVYGAVGGQPDAPLAAPPGVDASRTCENPGGGGGTGSPTPTDTGTGSPTPTNTGSPTPTDTGTGSPTPTDTGSPTPTDTGTPTNTGTPTQTNSGGTDPGGTFGELTMFVRPGIGTYGTDFVISGEVICKGIKIANARVTIYRNFVGGRTIDMMETTTDVQGQYAFRDTDLRATSDYQGTWNGRSGSATTACSSGSETGPERRRASVRPGVILNVRDATLTRGQSVLFQGAIVPAHPGKKVFLQVYHGQQGKWEYASETRLNSRGGYSIRFTRNATGYLLFRIAYPTQDLDHAWNVSRTVRVDWS